MSASHTARPQRDGWQGTAGGRPRAGGALRSRPPGAARGPHVRVPAGCARGLSPPAPLTHRPTHPCPPRGDSRHHGNSAPPPTRRHRPLGEEGGAGGNDARELSPGQLQTPAGGARAEVSGESGAGRGAPALQKVPSRGHSPGQGRTDLPLLIPWALEQAGLSREVRACSARVTALFPWRLVLLTPDSASAAAKSPGAGPRLHTAVRSPAPSTGSRCGHRVPDARSESRRLPAPAPRPPHPALPGTPQHSASC